MKKELIIKKCMKCGAMVEVLKDCTCDNCGIKCCGENMKIMVANSDDTVAKEKHVPTYERVEDEIFGDMWEFSLGANTFTQIKLDEEKIIYEAAQSVERITA